MAKKGPRENIGLVCTACGVFNYVTSYNKVNEQLKKQTTGEGTFPIMKFCSRCNKRTPHKVQKKLK
ncbi:MAG: 50S ribosomal protein L33 [Patescibacteria group bacterium]|nr:50S ribosomal protein L33 [Patescibacteria group bacterium]